MLVVCVRVAFCLLFLARRTFLCVIHLGDVPWSMAAKSGDSVGAKIMILEAIRVKGICLLLSGKKRLK